MTDFIIPCETVARLSKVALNAPPSQEGWFRSIRLENGLAIASNRKIMVVEKIGDFTGVAHLICDPALIAACIKEAAFASKLNVTVVDALKYATAKTGFGYVHPGNACIWSDVRSDFDHWREIMDRAVKPIKASKGGMFWEGETIALLAAASPSGGLVFAEKIDVDQPTVIRDSDDPNWFAIFQPYTVEKTVTPAVVPGWFK